MTDSSQPKNLSNEFDDIFLTSTIDSSDSIYTYSSGSDTITLGPILTNGAAAATTYTFASGDINSVTIDPSIFTFAEPEEWVDGFPNWDRVKDMCDQYPGLEIAFRNFQTVYNLVKDDYDNPTPKK